MSAVDWRKSSRSMANSNCVETAVLTEAERDMHSLGAAVGAIRR